MATIIGNARNNILIGTNQNDTIQGLNGRDQLYGLDGDDSLDGGNAKDYLNGGNGDDTLLGDGGRDTLIGGSGNDSLDGGNGNDLLQGSSIATAGEIDTLTGGGGSDTFVLGNLFGLLYDDGNTKTDGNGDYALITDFNINQDVIQLAGSKSNYILKSLPTGIGIYFDKLRTEPDELIAIVQGVTSLDLNAAYFQFQSVPAVNLSAVAAGIGGFAINGEVGLGFSGRSVSSAGDVNGDGLDDLIVGADRAGPNRSYSGKSYVVFGKADGSAVNLSAVASGIGGFAINGEAARDYCGRSVSSAGDVNGDGLDDLIVGALGADPNGSGSGKSYVVFGKVDGSAVNLSAVASGIGGFAINGEAAGDGAGFSVSNAGDVNGDGLDDLIVGALGADPNGSSSGKSYVVFGKADGSAVNLSAVASGIGGFAINGEAAGDWSGISVSSAGDVNGDGLDDLIVGACYADRGFGKSYVVFGKADGNAVNLSAVASGIGGFAINGEAAGDFSGGSVSSAGDVNGDGLDDLIIGASSWDSYSIYNYTIGKSYVVFGKADGTAVNLQEVASGIGGFVIKGEVTGDACGSSVSGAGDVNGDGFADLIVGAPFAFPNGTASGKSYVIYGGNFTNSVTQQGTTGNDILTGSALADNIVGGWGNDTLIGNGGHDVLYGAAGDDVIAISDLNFNRIDGGNGNDTLRLDGNGLFLDLTSIANNRITNIEQIDLTGAGSQSLDFNMLDVIAISETNRLIVLGNADDQVRSLGQNWVLGGTTVLNGEQYNQYTVGAVSLLVDSDITQFIS